MIKSFKTMAVAVFGQGTVCMHPELEEGSGELYLLTLKKAQEVGSEYTGDLPKGFKIKLRFNNTESIDALIVKLNDVKESMLEEIANA